MSRQVSTVRNLQLTLPLLVIFVAGTQVSAQTECSPTAVYKYPDEKCVVQIDRSNPGSPLPIQVPAKTTVLVRVKNQRQTEVIKYSTTTDAVAKPDLLGGFVKQLVSPLSAVVFASKAVQPLEGGTDSIYLEQQSISTRLKNATNSINRASVEVLCLQTYTIFDDKSACLSGVAGQLVSDDFERARIDTVNDLKEAVEEELPVAELKGIDDEIKLRLNQCPTVPAEKVPETDEEHGIRVLASQRRGICFAEIDSLQQNQNRLNDAVSALQAAQKTLLQVAPILDSLATPVETHELSIANPSNKKATVKITAVESIGKTSFDVAAVVITWQSTPFVLSTGVMLSTLKNQTFSNSPVYANGAPVLDGGKAVTKVTMNYTRPSVVFPLVMANIRLYSFDKGCHGNCSLLLGGGIGANLSSKTADFAVGPSFQYGSVLFTTALHYGRQTELTNGVKVGDMLGTSPPSLPTSNFWKPAFGFSISYRIPIP